MTLSTLRMIAISALAMFVAGCGGGSTEESSAAGKNATVEFRPLVGAGGSTIQKQRSGKLIKVTGDWVIINENGAEIWVPHDMVLEIRMGG